MVDTHTDGPSGAGGRSDGPSGAGGRSRSRPVGERIRALPRRVRALLRRLPSPTYLATLGFVGVPDLVVPGVEWGGQFLLFFLFGLWPMVAGLLPTGGETPTDWVETGPDASYPVLVSLLFLQGNPFVQWQSVRQLAAPALVLPRYRFRLPSPERYDQRTDFRLPVEGEWTVVHGGPTRAESHSWGVLAQRYACDLVVTDDDGRTYAGEGDDPNDFHCWDEPVVAPAGGVVVDAGDGHRDSPRTGWLDPRQRDVRGNYVTIEHDGGEHSVLAHLREGSLTVSEGDRVERGDVVGRCGHSGNSTEPHLHVHVQDGPSFTTSMGLPVQFGDVRTRSPDGETRTHDETRLRAGQRVAPLEASADGE